MLPFLARIFGSQLPPNQVWRKGCNGRLVPRVEALEGRCYLSPYCLITTDLGPAAPRDYAGDILRIRGTSEHDEVTIQQNDDTNELEVTCNGAKKHFASDAITKIDADFYEGIDHFDYAVGIENIHSFGGMTINGSDFKNAKTVTVRLGSGDDSAHFAVGAHALFGAFSLIKANLNIAVYGDFGNDTVSASFGEIVDVQLSLNAYLGYGHDVGGVALRGDLVGDADVTLNLQGGPDAVFWTGQDTLEVRAFFDVDMDTAASLDVTMSGEGGTDALTFEYLGELDGTLRLRARGGTGNDSLKATVKLRDFSDGSLDAQVLGESGNDTLEFHLEDASGGDVVIDALLDGGGNWDRYAKTGNVNVLNCEALLYATPGSMKT